MPPPSAVVMPSATMIGAGLAVVLGAITAVGGGTIRDILIRRVPAVLTSGLYAIPALVGAAIVVTAARTGHYGVPAELGGALACFLIRVLGMKYNVNAPVALEVKHPRSPGPPGPAAGPGDLPVLSD